MLDVARRGAMRREDGVAQVITGEQPGEIGCAPHVAASGRIAARRRRDSAGTSAVRTGPSAVRRAVARRRRSPDRSKSGAAKYTAPRLPSVTTRHAHAGAQRRRRERHRIGREHRHLVLVHLEEVEAAAPLAHVRDRPQRAQPVRLHGPRQHVQVAVDRTAKCWRISCVVSRSSSQPLRKLMYSASSRAASSSGLSPSQLQPGTPPVSISLRRSSSSSSAARRDCWDTGTSISAASRRDALERREELRARAPRDRSPTFMIGHDLPVVGQRGVEPARARR